jgi:carbonic anhydrase
MSMSCSQATAPINITGNTEHTCSMKCSYAFTYPLTNLTLENVGQYLRFGPEPQATAPVVFNNAKFTVQEMRLYQPSLHTFGGRHVAGELVVVHTNISGGHGLLVCVPVMENGPIGDGTGILAGLVERAAQSAPSSGGNAGSITLPTFTFGKFIPYSSPFFTYVGTLPYTPCNGQYSIVVMSESGGVGVDSLITQKMQRVLTANTYKIHTNPGGLFYNSKGASSSSISSGAIYIECQPTGEDGQVMVHKKVGAPWLDELESKFPNAMKVAKALLIAIVVGIGAYFIWKAIGAIGTKMAANSPHAFGEDDSQETAVAETAQEQQQHKAQAAAESATDSREQQKQQQQQQQGMGMGMGMPPMM